MSSPSPFRQDLFATPIWVTDVASHAQIAPALCTRILDVMSEDADGEKRSNRGGWHSQGDLHASSPFRELSGAIEQFCTAQIAADVGCPPEIELKVWSMWANVSPPGASNAVHDHGRFLLSGSYYVEVPPDAGDIRFVDPRGAARILTRADDVLTGPSMFNDNRQQITPTGGQLILFPGWLPHEVLPNGSDRDRISIGFNVDLSRRDEDGSLRRL